MTLSKLTLFEVPRNVVAATNVALGRQGKQGFEAFVLWTGRIRGDAFQVRSAHVPEQFATRSEEGVCVTVGGDELHKLNVWLFEHAEILAVQVHSHPTHAYHSETDDTYPIVTTRGGLSIVVPSFGRDGVDGARVAVYRLGASGWRPLSTAEIANVVRWTD